ncbi:MAG: aminoglycoside phosphotransferase, partial [Rickettsiales bacterium]|nr:aminoglycoside phosphotransferase [Rickettsiales bacterium]
MSKPEKDRLDETDVLAAMREERRHLALKFLEKNGAEQDLSNSLGNDASFRTYYRLKEPADALLMDSPAAHEPVEPFVKIAEHLRSLGLSAPEILAKDLENNFLIIEDFGDKTFSRLFAAGHNREELYNLAIDVLVKLHNDVKSSWVRIPEYTIKTFIDETGRTLNWYYPILKGEKPSGALKEKWVAVWGQLFDSLPDIEETLILRDY